MFPNLSQRRRRVLEFRGSLGRRFDWDADPIHNRSICQGKAMGRLDYGD